jgi:hypothetical protein
MKNRAFATLGTLALLAAGTAFGQGKLVADIPFEFSLSRTVLPAGQYDVTAAHGVLTLHCYASGTGALATVTDLGLPSSQAKERVLVFNKYGDKYFLAEVWPAPGTTDGAAVPQSKAEREIARGASVARVTIPVRSGVVTLASLR